MEMNASKVARHKIFDGKPSFVDKKCLCEMSTEEIQEIMDKAVPETTNKSHQVRDEVIYRRIRKVSPKIWKVSNTTVEILRIYEDYVTAATFTLMLQNGLLVLVAPHFQNQ